MIKNLVKHASRYSLAGLAGTFAGLISFPILTRMLPVADYGLMSLVITTIFFVSAFGKAGIQFSIVRYYSDAEGEKNGWDLRTYYATIVYGMLITGVVIMVLWLCFVSVTPVAIWESPKLQTMLQLTAILVLAEVIVSMLSGILQARQQSGWLSIYRVVDRYFVLLATIVTLFYLSRSLEGVFYARIFAQLSMVAILAWLVLRHAPLNPSQFSPRYLKDMLFYGFPLLGNELVAIILGLGDRYIIQWMSGPESLGAYSAAYNLCEYVRMMLVIALFQAIRPMYFKIWSDEGPEATKAFVERSLYFYLIICFPVIAGVSAVAPELLTLLTTGDYVEGAVVIPSVIAGLMLYGVHVMVGAGIFIEKSSILMWLTLIAAVLNMILNYLLIPPLGILGAGIATMISYVVLTSLEAYYGRKVLKIDFPVLAAVKFAVLAAIMYACLTMIHHEQLALSILMKVIAGGVIYVTLVLLSDPQARQIIRKRVAR